MLNSDTVNVLKSSKSFCAAGNYKIKAAKPKVRSFTNDNPAELTFEAFPFPHLQFASTISVPAAVAKSELSYIKTKIQDDKKTLELKAKTASESPKKDVSSTVKLTNSIKAKPIDGWVSVDQQYSATRSRTCIKLIT
jgi:hypothetical protein